MNRFTIPAMSLSIALGLAGCGGGGGGDNGGSSSSSGGSAPVPTLQVGATALSFSARAPGIDPDTQIITATVAHPELLSGTLYFFVGSSGPAVAEIYNIGLNGTIGSATVRAASSSFVGSGTHTSKISVRACLNSSNCSSGELNGSPQTINVTYTVGTFTPRHRLVASSPGVAFASLPDRSSLTRTLAIRDTLGHPVSWAASADQSWLQVTPNGTAPGDLVLTANPAGLAADQIHYATVTIASGESAVNLQEHVRVGLWVGSQAAAPSLDVTATMTEVVTDPVRPYAYVHNDGNSLFVYHVYTGELVATIALGRPLGEMAVAPDGSQLVVAGSNSISAGGINSIDLDTRQVGPAWIGVNSGATNHLEWVRHDGADVLITGLGTVWNVATRSLAPGRFGTDFYAYRDAAAASRDGRTVCMLNRGLSPNTLRCQSFAFTDVDGDAAIFLPLSQGSTGSNGQDVALNASGSRVYAASGAPYVFAAASPSLVSVPVYLTGIAYPGNVEMSPDGRLFTASALGGSGPDTWYYDATETLLGTMRVATDGGQLMADELKFSGDGLRIVALVDNFPNIDTVRLMDAP